MKQFISLIAFIALISPIYAQQNELLERSFWTKTTSADQVADAIAAGANPLEFNRSGFNPTTFAILADAPINTIAFLLNVEGNAINEVTHDSRNYLMWAGLKGNYELIELILKKGGDILIVDSKGNNLQTYTAMGGTTDERIYELYKKQGLKLEAPNRNGGTVVHYLAQNISSLEELDYFKKEGIDFKALDSQGNSLVHYAASQGNIKLIEQLIATGFDVKAKNMEKENALFFAARGKRRFTNDPEIFKFLMEKGLDLRTINASNNNLLHYVALSNKNKEIYDLLLSQKVDPQQVNNEGDNPLMNAASRNNELAIRYLLPLTKEKALANKEGYTLLTYALRHKNKTLLENLLSHPNNFSQVDTDGNNLIFHLTNTFSETQKSFFETYLQLLLKNGVTIQESSLHAATLQERPYLIEQLVKYGGDINSKSKEGITPLQQAAIRGTDLSFIKVLINLGADQTVLTEFDESIYELAQANEMLQGNLEFLK